MPPPTTTSGKDNMPSEDEAKRLSRLLKNCESRTFKDNGHTFAGMLTLSNKALCFESLGVGQYEKPARYDLSRGLKQVIKPELTGPLGARLFDKAVMYRSTLRMALIY
ncbi:phytyl ester synthase 1, chloroplastic-like isoform X2 [Silene latifolia]|uniref:phytyl ester synthase 1, chloroplastic-like isoform X2 n=1 Tax=Silene latifolia TaxID=37657 RepID=UPI003D76EC58